MALKHSLALATISAALAAGCGDGAASPPPALGRQDAGVPPAADSGPPPPSGSASDAGGGAPGTASSFVGTWTFVGAEEVTTCGDKVEKEALAGSVKIAVGQAGAALELDRSLVVGSRGCVVKFDVSGNVATGRTMTCRERAPLFDLTRNIEVKKYELTTTDGVELVMNRIEKIWLDNDTTTSCESVVTGAKLMRKP
jgi:hypothetical protein